MSVNISRGTNAALDRLATRSLGAGISHNSGTYKRLKNLIDEQGKDALVTLAQNTSSKKKESYKHKLMLWLQEPLTVRDQHLVSQVQREAV